MRKAEEYKRHADECRRLAAASSNEDSRSLLLEMAQTWESLARDRLDQLARQKRISELEGGNEA